jgi:flavin-dependent dehydrogenase
VRPAASEELVRPRYDVVIIGAGLAGLTLTRHLLLHSDKRILLLERRPSVPSPRQKVGESTVQLAAYYYSRVLDLEEHLWHDQLLKYNLRFYWKTPGRRNDAFEDYSQAYIRTMSNIACYQLDRNTFEAAILEKNLREPRLEFEADVHVAVELRPGDQHVVTFTRAGVSRTVQATWVVDASGRGKCLARRMDLTRANTIHHGTSFFWVDGLLDIERLTPLHRNETRKATSRSAVGHFPQWLATNHFMEKGLWFWVIPLRGKTSLGLVYDNQLIPRQEVETPELLCMWLQRHFPLFAADLAGRRIVDRGSFRDFSYDCAQTISPDGWALSGEAGRFTDPFYSPGSDLISIHNTLIADAIIRGDAARSARLYEQLMRVAYQATVPSYAVSYNVLGDQEAFVLKYTWELSVYFGFYVFPFINDLLTNERFIPGYLARFARLGRLNATIQQQLRAFAEWKLRQPARERDPIHFDFTRFATLRRAEQMFYRIGCGPEEAFHRLDEQLVSLQELALFIQAHLHAAVTRDARATTSAALVDAIASGAMLFEPDEIRARWRGLTSRRQQYDWTIDPDTMAPFRGDDETADVAASDVAAVC